VVIADHRHDEYLTDLVNGLRTFVPAADLVIYNSGDPRIHGDHACHESVPRISSSRPLLYAKVTPFFLDMFEWAAGGCYDYVLNAETDMAWLKPGFEEFVVESMRDHDYMAPGFERSTARTSRWRPYHSLRAELPELMSLLRVTATNRCFSPGQVFSARYIDRVVSSPIYPQLRDFVMRNQEPEKSFTLQEVLLPTLVDSLSLVPRDYPGHLRAVNRYRPYHASPSVKRAIDTPDAYFVHPIRRDNSDAARLAVRQLYATRPTVRATT